MRTTKSITPYFEDGKFAGVRVTLGDEDFVIVPKDHWNDGKIKLPWRKATDILMSNDLITWNYPQVCLVMAYREKIDKVLEYNGGDKLDNCYWVASRCGDGSLTYCYDGNFGTLDYMTYGDACCIRPIRNLKR